MNSYRQIGPACYLAAAALVFFPLYDSAVNLIPWTVSSAQWRFGAIGVLSNTLMIVCLGALVAVAGALASNHVRVRQAFGVLSWVLAVALLVAIAAFAMDALQARRQIRADLLTPYRIASITAEVKLLVGALTFAMLGRAMRLDRNVRQDPAIAQVLVAKQKALA